MRLTAYRNCRFCSGKGCLACASEADKDYKRQFPDGPVPIATIATSDPDFVSNLASVLSGILPLSDSEAVEMSQTLADFTLGITSEQDDSAQKA